MGQSPGKSLVKPHLKNHIIIVYFKVQQSVVITVSSPTALLEWREGGFGHAAHVPLVMADVRKSCTDSWKLLLHIMDQLYIVL